MQRSIVRRYMLARSVRMFEHASRDATRGAQPKLTHVASFAFDVHDELSLLVQKWFASAWRWIATGRSVIGTAHTRRRVAAVAR